MVNPVDVWLQFLIDWNEAGQKNIMRNYSYSGNLNPFMKQLRKLSLTFRKDVEIKHVKDEIQIRIV